MGLATRLNSTDHDIRALHRGYDLQEVNPSNTIIADTRRIVYFGVSELSVEIHFDDGSTMRVTNPNFSQGLDIHTYEKDT